MGAFYYEEYNIREDLISEYIGLAQEKVRDRRLNEWINMVDEKMSKLEVDVETVHMISYVKMYHMISTSS